MADPVVTFKVSVEGAAQLKEFLRRIPSEELPYVIALGFWRIANRIVKQGEVTMRQNFTIRSRRVLTGWSSFTSAGNPATGRGAIFEMKREFPNTSVIVGHRDDFMALQETGGTKLPDPAKNRTFLAIPTRLTWAQRTRTGAIPRALADYMLLREQLARLGQRPESGPNVSTIRSKADQLSTRLRRQVGAFKKGDLEILFLRRPSAHIRPRAGLFDMAQREFDANAGREFEVAWEQAMKTMLGRS